DDVVVSNAKPVTLLARSVLLDRRAGMPFFQKQSDAPCIGEQTLNDLKALFVRNKISDSGDFSFGGMQILYCAQLHRVVTATYKARNLWVRGRQELSPGRA